LCNNHGNWHGACNKIKNLLLQASQKISLKQKHVSFSPSAPLEWLFVFSIYFIWSNSNFLSRGSLGKENSNSVRIPAHWTEAPSISRTLFPTLRTHQLRAFIAHLHELCAARTSHQAAMSFLHRAHQQMHRHHIIFIIANYCAAEQNLFSPVTLRAITVCCLCVCVWRANAIKTFDTVYNARHFYQQLLQLDNAHIEPHSDTQSGGGTSGDQFSRGGLLRDGSEHTNESGLME